MTDELKDQNDKVIPTMDLDEFVDTGFLAYINRYVLHPCGLALSAARDDETNECVAFAGIWDARNDPEGYIYVEEDMAEIREKCERVDELIQSKADERIKLLGSIVQR